MLLLTLGLRPYLGGGFRGRLYPFRCHTQHEPLSNSSLGVYISISSLGGFTPPWLIQFQPYITSKLINSISPSVTWQKQGGPHHGRPWLTHRHIFALSLIAWQNLLQPYKPSRFGDGLTVCNFQGQVRKPPVGHVPGTLFCSVCPNPSTIISPILTLRTLA